MAVGKQYTINLPGDTQVQVPAWASETTLETMFRDIGNSSSQNRINPAV